MRYREGMKIALWEMSYDNRRVVLREVIIEITETKTGVLGQWSERPVSLQSLKGLGDDGEEYEKHWASWPESQANDFSAQWSLKKDTESGDMWIPFEATAVYNDFVHRNRMGIEKDPKATAVWPTHTDGSRIYPKGDVNVCAKHGTYQLEAQECVACIIDKMRREKVLA